MTHSGGVGQNPGVAKLWRLVTLKSLKLQQCTLHFWKPQVFIFLDKRDQEHSCIFSLWNAIAITPRFTSYRGACAVCFLKQHNIYLTEFVSPLCWAMPTIWEAIFAHSDLWWHDVLISCEKSREITDLGGQGACLSTHKPRTTTTTKIIFLKITLLTLRMVIWCFKGT